MSRGVHPATVDRTISFPSSFQPLQSLQDALPSVPVDALLLKSPLWFRFCDACTLRSFLARRCAQGGRSDAGRLRHEIRRRCVNCGGGDSGLSDLCKRRTDIDVNLLNVDKQRHVNDDYRMKIATMLTSRSSKYWLASSTNCSERSSP